MRQAFLVQLERESRRYHDLVSRIHNLTSIEELSLVAHQSFAEGVFAMMVVSYNDESADQRAFVVSGLIGMLPVWVELGWKWEAKLASSAEFVG